MRPIVFVVEGKNDAFKLKRVFDQPLVIETNGSAIDPESLTLLKRLDQTHDIILFLDPDHAGERIRRLVGKSLHHVYHAFIKPEDGKSENGKKVGIEHASKEIILEALNHIQMVHHESESDVTRSFLHEVGLIGQEGSKALREEICKRLNIGQPNGKTLYKRLHMFSIQSTDILEALHESSSEEEIRTELPKR